MHTSVVHDVRRGAGANREARQWATVYTDRHACALNGMRSARLFRHCVPCARSRCLLTSPWIWRVEVSLLKSTRSRHLAMAFAGLLVAWCCSPASCTTPTPLAFALPSVSHGLVRPGVASQARASIQVQCGEGAASGAAQLPTVVYEDSDLLVLNKPQGIGFHDEENGAPGILSVVRGMQAEGQLAYSKRLFGVHRLDKVTSGCLVLAKSSSAAGEAISALRDKRAAKYYVAISDKKPSKKMGTISGDMTRTRRSAWRLTNTKRSPAVTRFLHRPFSISPPGPCPEASGGDSKQILRMFVMRPLTGKTHQLRVALRALGAPIVGDLLYYPGMHQTTASFVSCVQHIRWRRLL